MKKSYGRIKNFTKYVKYIQVFDDSNNRLPVIKTGDSWEIYVKNNANIVILYVIDIGILEVERLKTLGERSKHLISYLHSDGGVILSYDIFVYPENIDLQNNVFIKPNIPNEWKAYLGSAIINNGYRTIGIPEGFIVVGQLESSTRTIDDFRITTIYKKDYLRTINYNDILGNLLNIYRIIYGEFPGKTFTAVLEYSNEDYCGGTILGNIGRFVIGVKLIKNRQLILTYYFAHELFHLWNISVSINDDNIAYWVHEGLAEYYSLLSIRRLKIIHEEMHYKYVKEKHTKMLNNKYYGTSNFLKANNEIFNNKNAFEFIYYGGAFLWMWLDNNIRMISNCNKSLDIIVRYLYECCYTGKILNINELYHIIESISNKSTYKQFANIINYTYKCHELKYLDNYYVDS